MKYFVIALRWDSIRKEQTKHIVGEFDRCIHAKLFKEAYDANYKTESVIIDEQSIVYTK